MSDNYLRMDAGRVKFDIARLFEAYPELEEDQDLRADVVEGETDLDEVLKRLFKSWSVDAAMANGAKEAKADLAERQKRFERRVEVKKGIALSLLEAANIDKRELPIATFSRRAGRVSVVVDDVFDLPQGAFVLERKPLPAAELKKLIEAEKSGEFPGAHLELGDDTLSVRVK